MLYWLKNFRQPPRKIFLVHGEKVSAEHFRQYLTDNTGWDIMVPEYRQAVPLD
jgi:metallo-beta-lactamase family protein